MLANNLFKINNIKLFSAKIPLRCFSSNSTIDIDKLEKESDNVPVINDIELAKEEQIELKRNKSGLRERDRNILLNTYTPPKEDDYSYKKSLKYLRKSYGLYGSESGIDPALCWPTPNELADTLEYERICYNASIPEMIAKVKEERDLKNKKIMQIQEDVMKKLAKLDGWKKEMQARIAKKEAEAYAAKERRDKLIEEVKRHFGHKVNPNEDKFKELLEKKEKEQRKQMKEARRLEKEAKLVEKIKNKGKKTEETNTTPD